MYWYDYANKRNGNLKIEIPGIDLATFQTFSKFYYAKDKNYVLLNGYIVEDADPVTFKVVNRSYAKDASHVYYLGRKIPNANPLSFKVEREGLNNVAKDDRFYFLNSYAFEPCDKPTFKRSKNYGFAWFYDSQCVYHKGKVVPNADPNTLRVLDSNYAKDKNGVYYKTERIEGADWSTFAIDKKTGYGRAKDKNNCYKKGLNIDCDVKGEKRLSQMSIADAQNLGLKMFQNKVNAENKIKAERQSRLNETMEDIVEANKNNVLTTKNINDIDLSRLPVGHAYSLKSQLDNNKRKFVFEGVVEDVAIFKLFDKEIRGVFKEKRTVDGKLLETAENLIRSPIRKIYSPYKCEVFSESQCQYRYAINKSPTEETKVRTVTISFENGIWKTERKVDETRVYVEYFILDNLGLPLFHAELSGEKLYSEYIRE